MGSSRLQRALPRIGVPLMVAGLASCAGTPTTTSNGGRVSSSATAAQTTSGGGAVAPAPSTATSGDPKPSSGPSAGSTPVPGSAPAREHVTLAFAGDIHFELRVSRLLSDPAPLDASLSSTLGRADFAMANLETSIGTGGQPKPGKRFTFRAPPGALEILARAGIDAVSMANNHAVDFGPSTFGETLRAKANSPIPVVGIGANASEAFAPARVTVRGIRLSLLASSQFPDPTSREHAAGESSPGIATNLDMTRLRQAVRAAAASSDVVVVMLHWGTDYTPCADERQRETARLLAGDGADIVVGGHAHRPQGSGWLGATYVAYGLGNFVWFNNTGDNAHSGVLTLAVDTAYAKQSRVDGSDGRIPRTRSVVVSGRWAPMLIGTDGVPRRPTSAETTGRLRANWVTAAGCGGLSPRAT